MRTAITNVPGLVSWMNPDNMALIRHIGTHMQTEELFRMLALDEERFPDLTDSRRLQLFPIEGREKESFVNKVVEHAEEKPQKPRRIDAQEYVDLLDQCVILEPRYCNDDAEWKPLRVSDKASPEEENPKKHLGWFIQLLKIRN